MSINTHYYTLRHSLTEIRGSAEMCMRRAFLYVKPSLVKCLRPDCAAQFTQALNSSIYRVKYQRTRHFICTFQLLPEDLKDAGACQLTEMCRTLIF